MTRVLVVEDEDRIARFVERGLRAAGYAVSVARDGHSALANIRIAQPDLIVLDLGLPDLDGMDVLSQARSEGFRMPVVMLSARGQVADRVRGLDGGADDYLTKPFAFDELLARIRVRLREPSDPEPGELVRGDLRLDLRLRRASTPDLGEIELSPREFALLETLMRRPGSVHSREQLLDRVWGVDFDGGSNVVQVYVSYLRAKIGAGRLETVRGAGYRIVSPADGDDPPPA